MSSSVVGGAFRGWSTARGWLGGKPGGGGTSTLGPVPGATSSDTVRAGGGPSMGPGADSGALRLASPDSTSRVSWSPTRSGVGSVGSSGCHTSRGAGADKSATRLHGMGVVPCTSTRGRGRGMLPSALTTARWQVGSGSCMRVTLVREPGGSTVGSPLTVNSWSRPWDTPTTEGVTQLGPSSRE